MVHFLFTKIHTCFKPGSAYKVKPLTASLFPSKLVTFTILIVSEPAK
jgi:hypothetical protein